MKATVTAEKFKEKYNKLTTSEQDCLKLLGLALEPVELSELADILKAYKIEKLDGKPFTHKIIQKKLEKSEELGLVIGQTRKRFAIKEQVHRHILLEADKEERLVELIAAIREVLPTKSRYSYNGAVRNYEVGLREMQFALLTRDDEAYADMFNTLITMNIRHYTRFSNPDPRDFFFGNPFNKDLLTRLSLNTQADILDHLLFEPIFALESINVLMAYLEELYAANPTSKEVRAFLSNAYIFQGKLKGNDALFDNLTRQAWVAFLRGDNEKAVTLFAEDLKLFKKKTRKRKVFFHYVAAPIYLVALLKTNDPAYYKDIITHAENAQVEFMKPSFQYLKATVLHLTNQSTAAQALLNTEHHTSFDTVFKGLATYWMGEQFMEEDLSAYNRWYQLAAKHGYKWLQLEYAAILSKLEQDKEKAAQYEEHLLSLQKETGIESMINAVRKVEDWERVLRALDTLTGSAKVVVKDDRAARVVWLVDFKQGYIQPKLQTKNKKGVWSAGRNVAMKRLHTGGEDVVDSDDQKIANTIYSEQSGYYGHTQYYFNYEKALKAMVGHPRLFLRDNPTVPVELTVVKPELIVEETKNSFEIKFSHPIEVQGRSINQETPTRFNFVEVEPAHQEIAKALGKQKVTIPKSAKKQLSAILSKMQGMIPLHSTLTHSEENLPSKRGDASIFVHLLPLGDGFKLEMFTKPAVETPPYFKPGVGRKEFIAEIKGKRTLIKRTLSKESSNAKQVESECFTLQKVDSYQGEWTFDEVDTCLNILLELEPLKESGLVKLEWPKGEKIRLNRQVGFDQFSMNISRENDWFNIDGALQLDDKEVLDMKRLLGLLENNETNFIEIQDGQFIALTTAFKKKLAEMNAFLDRSNGGMRVHNLAVAAMEDFTDQIGNLEASKEWKNQVNRLKRARKMEVAVPSTFQADLRSYQLVGYQWLQRLAYWGVGACLADDMGLGKTIQALAVLVERAGKGPALVVAPASVCRNWRKESLRFAPTLNPIIFGSTDRKQTIKTLKKHDLLITTYGLLQQEEDLFATKKFGTIILDEAQAIKNRQAKRSKAAMKLKGDFKILTTGTPIENHLGELWNLFQFLNPGLLGSHDFFQERYALPIEKNKDKTARMSLKKLIQPFILRRKKNDVLDDLPSKTEITLTVELSKEEKAFYEALRQTAIEKIESDQEEKGHAGMQILAEITRLRQACCHPKLVKAAVNIASSKLQLLEETVEELVANGHKALVFSQFVGHLKIIETMLQEKNITYQYLDGQTSLKKREERITAFQSGEGDVFLISLKAGGVGLNLTAADYVIHTDPWWNPAVEDQASDRAHRIGQERPVTIYRLVTENTIEEKIVALHHHKRDLADSLLEGTERSGRLSSKELLELIREK